MDNAYISIDTKATIEVFEDAITDHDPLLVKIIQMTKLPKKSVLTTIWRRNKNTMSPIEMSLSWLLLTGRISTKLMIPLFCLILL